MKPSRLGWGHSWAGVASALTGRSGSLKLVFVGLLLVAGTLTTQITVDRSLVSAFPDATPVRVADEYLNTHFAGTAFLDVYIDSGSMDGALDPEFLSQLSALQLFMETLPHVQKTVSVLDYLKEMHRALNDERSVSGVGVTQVEIEQELFLYESGATPESLRQELDFDRRRVLVRGVMNSRYSSEEDETVARLQKYVDANFVGAAEVNLSGRVNTRYHWMSRLGASHVAGVALSLMLVFVAASLLFRSLTMGVLCVLPVVLAVLSVYSVMYLSGGYLEPTTSMFAAISIGVGVDYAIHLLYRLRLESKLQQDYPSAVAATLRHVGRACMYNALGIGLGVLVLALSSLGTLQNFGVLIATATFAGLVASFVFLPALYRPAAPQRAVLLVAVCCACLLPWQEPLASTTGVGIAQKVDSRAEPAASIRTLSIVLVNRSGRTRSREATVLRRTDGSKTESLFVLSAPAALRDVAFLTLSDTTGRDQRWLFRPIADRARRLPAANRGDAFIGTDFSYADVQSHLKFDLEEFRFSPAAQYGSDQWHLTGELKTERLQRELGYTRILARGDRATYLPRKIDFLDGQGQVSKSITVPSVTMLGDFALPSEIVATTRRSGHKTMFKYGETRLLESVPDRLFDASSLRKGLSVELSRMQ